MSHAWAADELGRDNHARVQQLGLALRSLGWRVWVDAERLMSGQLDVALSKGLRASDAMVVCLTRAYADKVRVAAETPVLTQDNCLKELLLASAWRTPVVPAVMEPCMRHADRWGPVLCMRLGGHMYADASDDPIDALSLHRILCSLFGGGPLRGIVLGRSSVRRTWRVHVTATRLMTTSTLV